LKRITSICLVFFSVFALFIGVADAAVQFTGDVDEDLAVMLIDANSGYVMFEQNANEQIRPASTTKILTCIVALENGDLNDKVTVSEDAADVSGSSLDIVEDEEIELGDLLTGMMMESGNDAATAVAEHIANGSVSDFVDMMNDKAKDLGMDSSRFTNVHGKDKDGPYVTAADMAKLARYAYQNDTFRNIVARTSFTMPQSNKRRETKAKNTNHLLHEDDDDYYRYANGMKTGSTEEAGGCLVASASKGDADLICLVFGDHSREGRERWPLAEELFDFGFEEYTTVDMAVLLENVEPIQVQVENYAANDPQQGLLEFLPPTVTEQYRTMEKAVADALLGGMDELEHTETYTVPVPIQAPVDKNDILGSVTYTSKATGQPLYTGNLVASRDVLESGTETGAEGGTPVKTMPPAVPEEIVTQQDNTAVWWWLLIPAGLVAFLVFRLLTVNRRKRKRFTKKRRPHYSYKIKR